MRLAGEGERQDTSSLYIIPQPHGRDARFSFPFPLLTDWGVGGLHPLTLGSMVFRYKAHKRKQLPKIIKSIRPNNGLKRTLYDEEVFDCIKASILQSGDSVRKEQPSQSVLEITRPKRFKKLRNQKIKDELLKRFKEEDLITYNSKKKRCAIQGSFASNLEFNLFCDLVKEKVRASKKTKKRTRRSGKKKGARHSKYGTYINSDVWESRKNRFWQTHARRCAVCDTTKHIQLHHMDYSMMGNEPDEHLIALCEDHHKQYHFENGVSRHMIRSTLAFVEKYKTTGCSP